MTYKIGGIAKDHIKQIIDRIEKLEEEKKTLSDDLRDIYNSAKGHGYDPIILRKIVRIRKMDDNKRMEEQEMLELYMRALGMEDYAEPDSDTQSDTEIADHEVINQEVRQQNVA